MLNDNKHYPSYLAATLVLLGLSLFCAVTLLSAGGSDGRLGASPDSSTYISMAHSFVEGQGFRSYYTDWNTPIDAPPPPVIHYPPGYSLLLAGLDWLAFDLRGQAVLVVNGTLLTITLYLTGRITHWLTGSIGWSGLAIWLVAVSYTSSVHLRILSEPPFIALLLGGVFCLLRYQQAGSQSMLVLAGGLLGLMCLTRYAGIAIAGAAAGLIFIHPGRTTRTRLTDTIMFGLLTGLPLALWLLRNLLVSDQVVGGGHHATQESVTDNLRMAYIAWANNFRSHIAALGMLVIVSAVGIIALAEILRRYNQRKNDRIPRLAFAARMATTSSGTLASIIFLYSLFILVYGSISNTIIDVRKFAPIFPLVVALSIRLVSRIEKPGPITFALLANGLVMLGLSTWYLAALHELIMIAVVLLTCVLYWWWRSRRAQRLRLRPLPLLLFVLLTLFIAGQYLDLLTNEASVLLGYMDERENNETVRWIRDNLSGAVLYSNNYDLLYYHLDPPVIKNIPGQGDRTDIPGSGRESIPEFADRVAKTQGYVVFLDYVSREYLISEEELVASDRFVLVKALPFGRIYRSRR